MCYIFTYYFLLYLLRFDSDYKLHINKERKVFPQKINIFNIFFLRNLLKRLVVVDDTDALCQ